VRHDDGVVWGRGAARRSGPAVAIIDAGLGGVACAVNLVRSGNPDVTVFEKASGPGGVWWQNDYPGCEVDVHSHAYSFMPYVWRRTHGTWADVQQYVEDVIDHFGIRSRFEFDTAVSAVVWDEERAGYWIETAAGRRGPFDVVASAVGMLSNPNIPRWAESSAFRGALFHSSAFERRRDLSDKRVAPVGTGSSACQPAPSWPDSPAISMSTSANPGTSCRRRPGTSPPRSRPATGTGRGRRSSNAGG
jgi:cation diffusion facilitator CzcD-associated flavoprotein CzcO